jgi:hypothetical protein
MIEGVITHLNLQVAELNCFAQISGLCEWATEAKADSEDMKFPVIYKGKDNLRFITTFDFRSGAFFHMKESNTDIEQLESPRVEDDYLKYTTHLKAYAIIRRSLIDDSEYSHEKLANNIVHTLNDSNINSLKASIGVNRVNVFVTGYSTDSAEINDIFQNIEIQWRHDLTIVVIDYDIILEGYQQCFTNYTC